MTPIESYAAPTTIEEAVQRAAAGDASVLAGGTDLMLAARSAPKRLGRVLLNLRRIPVLRGITSSNGTIRIGALTTVTEILEDRMLRERARVLPVAADCFASSQVRNSATIGGNICNASPAADLVIPLLLLEAELELASWSGGKVVERTIALSEFFIGPGTTRIERNEILTSCRFAAPDDRFVGAFTKFGTRPALDVAVVSVGIAGARRNGALEQVRVAFGAVAPVPLRGRRTEAAIEAQPLSDATIARAATIAASEIAPISDVRASAWYRTELTRRLTERTLRDVSRT